MRKLAVFLVILALFWSVWWLGASLALQQGLRGALAGPGLAAERVVLRQGGFPLRLGAALEGVSYVDPARGLRASLPPAVLSASALWPDAAMVRLSPGSLKLDTPGQTFDLTPTDAEAALGVHLGPDLALDRLALESGPWTLSASGAPLLAAEGLVARLVQVPEAPARYAMSLESAGLAPGAGLRSALRIGEELPAELDRFALGLTLDFAAPLTRHDLAGPLPRPEALRLEELALRWGEIGLSGAADLRLDAEGLPEGTARLEIEGWQELLARVRAAGFAGGALDRMALVLQALANRDGNPEVLSLPLRFAAGQMYLDEIPLGPAPRLFGL